VIEANFSSGTVRAAAIAANQKLCEYPNTMFVEILEAGEMDDHLSRKLCFFARTA